MLMGSSRPDEPRLSSIAIASASFLDKCSEHRGQWRSKMARPASAPKGHISSGSTSPCYGSARVVTPFDLRTVSCRRIDVQGAGLCVDDNPPLGSRMRVQAGAPLVTSAFERDLEWCVTSPQVRHTRAGVSLGDLLRVRIALEAFEIDG